MADERYLRSELKRLLAQFERYGVMPQHACTETGPLADDLPFDRLLAVTRREEDSGRFHASAAREHVLIARRLLAEGFAAAETPPEPADEVEADWWALVRERRLEAGADPDEAERVQSEAGMWAGRTPVEAARWHLGQAQRYWALALERLVDPGKAGRLTAMPDPAGRPTDPMAERLFDLASPLVADDSSKAEACRASLRADPELAAWARRKSAAALVKAYVREKARREKLRT